MTESRDRPDVCVTPEMIEAGADVLLSYDVRDFIATDRRLIAAEVYQAMAQLAPQRHSAKFLQSRPFARHRGL